MRHKTAALPGGKRGGTAKLRRGGESMQARARMDFAAGDDVRVFAAARRIGKETRAHLEWRMKF